MEQQARRQAKKQKELQDEDDKLQMTVLKQTPLKIDFGTEYTSFKMTDTPQSFFESIAGLEKVSSAIYNSFEPGASANSLCVASPEKNVVRRCTSSTTEEPVSSLGGAVSEAVSEAATGACEVFREKEMRRVLPGEERHLQVEESTVAPETTAPETLVNILKVSATENMSMMMCLDFSPSMKNLQTGVNDTVSAEFTKTPPSKLTSCPILYSIESSVCELTLSDEGVQQLRECLWRYFQPRAAGAWL